ncbi:MAG: ABC transporter permease [Bacteroidetes bacterium]|nr:ABC transporter permease [Bacteroidota bacterium]
MLWKKIILESFRFAYHALVSNKLRTFLSLLGITIGIFAIISVFTVVDSLEANVRKSVASLGSNVVFVQKWPWAFGGDYPWWKYLNRPTPQLDEVPEIQHRSDMAAAVCFIVNANKTVKYHNNSVENADITGVSHEYYQVQSFELSEGRYFTEAESNSGKPYALIGVTLAESLFGESNALGKRIKLFGREATIIGLFKKEGESMMGNSTDNMVLLPVRYLSNFVDLRSDRLDPFIMVKAKEGIAVDELKFELTGIMRSIRKLKPLADDDFALNEISLLSSGFDSIFAVIGMAGWIIGGFSIIVGGFGIANIMFVSVKERTNLIGIQKSLGAKNYFILIQFLIESVVLCLIGGIIGLLIIYGGTLLVNNLADMEVALTRSNIVLGLTISVLIGIISGFIPAYSASQLDPVEAMRS